MCLCSSQFTFCFSFLCHQLVVFLFFVHWWCEFKNSSIEQASDSSKSLENRTIKQPNNGKKATKNETKPANSEIKRRRKRKGTVIESENWLNTKQILN